MDILTQKQYKTYSRLSRYSSCPIYYNTVFNKYEHGTMPWLDNSTSYLLYKVQPNDTYDSIALKYYNNPTYYWIICSFNKVTDPFSYPVLNQILRIPVLSSIEFEEN